MIGDYVKYTNPPYVKVASITKKKIGYHIKSNEPRLHYVRLCEVNPIPLTPEILEKNEIDSVFKTHYKGLYLEYHPEAGMIMLYVYNNGSFQPTGISFKYVHELQNALRILGITKEIEL